MERTTFTVLFYIKRTKNLRDGTSPIYVRITMNGMRSEFGLKRSISVDLWNTKTGYAIGTSKEIISLNNYIDFVKGRLHQHRIHLEEHGKLLTAANLRNSYLGVEEQGRTILGVFKEHNEWCESLVNIDFAPGTVDRYKTCYQHVERFIKYKYRKHDLHLTEINPMFVKYFETWLKTERKCSHNTATKYLKNFKKITRIAITNGWLINDPFRNKKFRLKEVDMDFLDAQELEVMRGKQFEIERLQQVKDVYLFCCFTGLAFIDVKTLTYGDIIEKDGQQWIKKKRHKTKNWFHVPLLSPALQLINKYRSHPHCLLKGVVFPVMTNQKMNAYLKEIADLCGIKKHLSTHTARHTFATTVTLANHVSIEVVSKMLGHSSINMTKKYARVVDDLISRDMQKVYGKYDGLCIQ